ncbi:MAG TPA: hypothetical protein VEL51_24405 [Vicinamibacterales bacterium]|nr:hypothetical protein [Vicinamibacterales bacterium]
MNPELRLIAAPGPTYAALARAPSRIGPITALRRPLLVAMIIGCSTAILATRHATPSLVLSTTICWSVVVLIQIAIALAVIAAPARRTVGIPRALDLFFAAHAPWSLWMLALIARSPTAGERTLVPVLVAALVPIVLTPRILAAFFREVLELDPREAIRCTIAHQAITWSVLIVMFGWAVALIPRIVQWLK